ncbi:MAG TPA: ATP-binding protein, partial [Tepidisphaeraceae bacterium]|nr:ATP-binding protein [Tepidisphaeraceae bacterium]
AHEFNNLLTPITSYCQMALASIEKGKQDDPIIKKAMEKSLLHATRAGKICSSLLGLVRGQSDHGRVSVQKIVDEALSVLSRDPTRDGIALRVQVRPGLEVRGDSIQLEQVLLNLLINARQAMLAEGQPRGGSITIRADEDEDSSIKISIADTGPGIAPEHVEKVFEPFFTTKTNPKMGEPKGTGLGLHICKQIVEQHDGRIEVESQVGRGTTFTIRLGKQQQPQTLAA